MGELKSDNEMTVSSDLTVPQSPYNRLKLMFLAVVVVFGGISGGYQVSSYFKDQYDSKTGVFKPRPQLRLSPRIPTSIQPGPARTENASFEFRLDASNSILMNGMDDVTNERWCDIADNFYTRQFAAGYSNEGDHHHRPKVRIAIEPKGSSLKGRLEARGLKPNFAYQIKLMGDFADRSGFEAIGRVGRWRLPGFGTNYTDYDYETYPEAEKHKVEAYVFFDYFVTDLAGNAVREFNLDSSLHVLWRTDQDTMGLDEQTVTRYNVEASSSATYSSPSYTAKVVGIWAERERERYTTPDQTISLPAQSYKAFLVLTEESFHSYGTDGGFWATVFKAPVEFAITKGTP